MSTYGSSPKEVIQYLEKPQEATLSAELLLTLAKAYQLVLELEKSKTGSTFLKDKQLVLDPIEKAWREALFIRASLPPSMLANQEDSPVVISKLGIVTANEDKTKPDFTGSANDLDTGFTPHEGVPKKHRGTRRYTRRISRGGG